MKDVRAMGRAAGLRLGLTKKKSIEMCLSFLVCMAMILAAYVSPAVAMYKADVVKYAVLAAVAALAVLMPGVRAEGRMGRFLSVLCLLPESVCLFLATVSLNRFDHLPAIGWAAANVLLITGFCLILLGIFKRPGIVCLLSEMFFYVWSVADYYVTEFRGSALLPWDFAGTKAAADVAGGYVFDLYKQQLMWILLFLLMYRIVKKLPAVGARRAGARGAEAGAQEAAAGSHRTGAQEAAAGSHRTGILSGVIQTAAWIAAGLAVMAAGMLAGSALGLENNMVQTAAVYRDQGMPVSFLHYCRFLKTEKPDGYSADRVEELAQQYALGTTSNPAPDGETIVPDNLIVIMNESFTDFRTVGSLPEIDDCLTNWDALSGNVSRGNLYVPTFGGNTVNTEYEALTGWSVAYQGGGMPLTSGVHSTRPSLAWYLQETEGYEAKGMHLGKASNWNRSGSYPFLGLSDTIFLEDVEAENPDKFYHTVSDEWNFDKLISLYENKDSDRFFMFNVTIQNHGGYESSEGLEDADRVDLSAYGSYPMAENYLTCLKETDRAFQDLINYFAGQEENTMIVMFGDHHPKVEDGFFELLMGKEKSSWTKEDSFRRYATPYVIWTNYDRNAGDYGDISANYLGGVILEEAGLPLSPFYAFLKDLRAEYPVLSGYGVYDAGGTYHSLDEVARDPMVLNYRYFEYNGANDRRVDWTAFGEQQEPTIPDGGNR